GSARRRLAVRPDRRGPSLLIPPYCVAAYPAFATAFRPWRAVANSPRTAWQGMHHEGAHPMSTTPPAPPPGPPSAPPPGPPSAPRPSAPPPPGPPPAPAAGPAAGPAVGTAAECGQAGRGAAEEERRWRHLAGPLHRRGGALRGRAGLRHHQLHPEEQRVRRQGEGPEGAGGYGAEARQLAADWANARQVAHTGFLCGRHAEIVHG